MAGAVGVLEVTEEQHEDRGSRQTRLGGGMDQRNLRAAPI